MSFSMEGKELQVMEHIEIEVREPCIYRVPSRIRDVKPEAYTPQMVVIGPLHRSPKPSTATDGAETSSSYPWHLKKEYIKMEEKKKTYLESYTQRVGEDKIEEMRKTIQAQEENIRASYEESTEWIPSEYFVELILEDSVFIMEFIIRKNIQFPSLVRQDLFLLENQLPYFIFYILFNSIVTELCVRDRETFDHFILKCFDLKVQEKTNFKHFIDMFRYVYEQSLDDIPEQMRRVWRWPLITELRNADYLSQAGVTFKCYVYL
ncbi:hypothetical protein CARUB_v10022034mg [Capsella rubella]|uniref:Uncharacterized protein n=1 Tax=Capsella rubella TaxID=81985 RepID=R0ICX2_9BRAS|nr:hypothetical protein CARUB_v10022034mg [Capsella rubella]